MTAANQTQHMFAEQLMATSHQTSYLPTLTDFQLLLIGPVAAYWITATIYFLVEKSGLFEKYRIHESEEVLKRNKVSLREVFRSVITQQIIQTVFAIGVEYALTRTQPAGYIPETLSSGQGVSRISNNVRRLASVIGLDVRRLGARVDASLTNLDGVEFTGSEMLAANFIFYIGIPAVQFASGIVLADFWQYAWHRIFHENKFLYSRASWYAGTQTSLTETAEHVHAFHHRIYVTYSYGALYNTLTEAFIVDTIGTTLIFWLTGFTQRQALWFATLSIIKGVHDHCGYELPYNPLDMISKNNPAYHDVHHQNWGMKYNFSQVYLTFWDDLFGTSMPPEKAAQRYAAEKLRHKQKNI